MKDDHGPHLRIEPEEAAFELVAIGDGRRRVGHRGCVEFGQFDIDAMASSSSRLIDAGVDEQAMQPGIESVGIPKGGQITPGPDERVLHGVLGLFDIPEHEPGGAIQTGDRGACQLGEGVMIALPRSLHEVSLHHALGAGAAHMATLVEYGEATCSNRSDNQVCFANTTRSGRNRVLTNRWRGLGRNQHPGRYKRPNESF